MKQCAFFAKKLDGKWLQAPVPMEKNGWPDAKHVTHKGELRTLTGGTFYIASGRGKDHRPFPVATNLKLSGAPSERRRGAGGSLSELAKSFSVEPPTAFTAKSVKKYINALATFADWAASVDVFACNQVDRRTMSSWIWYMQKTGLDASTIIPKVRIVLS